MPRRVQDPITPHSDRLCEYMNGHPAIVLSYARYFGEYKEATSAKMLELDQDGFLLTCQEHGEEHEVRVAFTHSLHAVSQVKDMLMSLAKEAETALRGNDPTQQGRVRTKTVKKASKVLIEKYYPRLTLDFQTNKKIASEVAIIPSKRLRNKIAGFTTHLMKRIQRGPVRGISFKLQEEERERKDNYIPEVSALDISAIEIDTETQNLLKSLNFEELSGVTAVEVKQAPVETRRPRKERA